MRLGDGAIRRELAVACASLVGFVVAFTLGATGLRGSDQYWYVADVEALGRRGEHLTNSLFASSLIAHGSTAQELFVHDGLNLYLVAPLAAVFSGYVGWLLANLAATLAAAGMIGLTIYRNTADRAFAALVAVLYTLFPVTFWLSTQPLIEATTAPFVALALWALVRPDRTARAYGMTALWLAVAYLCRSTFALPLAALGLAALLDSRSEHLVWRRLKTVAGVTSVLVIASLLGAFVFRSSMPSKLADVAMNGMPGTSNMAFMLWPNPPTFELSLFLRKALSNLSQQFFAGFREQVFYAPFNLVAAAAVAPFFYTRASATSRLAAWAALVLIGTHVATIIIHQNQFRYLLVCFPATLVSAALFLHERFNGRRRLLGFALVAALLFSACAAVLLIQFLRKDAREDAKLREDVAELIAPVSKADGILVCNSDNLQQSLLAFTARPRPVVGIRGDYPVESYKELARYSNARWVLCPRRSLIWDRIDPDGDGRAQARPLSTQREEYWLVPFER